MGRKSGYRLTSGHGERARGRWIEFRSGVGQRNGAMENDGIGFSGLTDGLRIGCGVGDGVFVYGNGFGLTIFVFAMVVGGRVVAAEFHELAEQAGEVTL